MPLNSGHAFTLFLALLPLLLPLAAGIFLSRRAAASEAHRLHAWFLYLRLSAWIIPGAILLWLPAVIRLIEFLPTGDWPIVAYVFLGGALLLAPPILAELLFQLAAIGLCRRLVEPTLRPSQVAAVCLWNALRNFVPIILLTAGAFFFYQREPRSGALLSGSAAVLFLAANNRFWRAQGIEFQPIEPGPLHDRILALAHRINVRPSTLNLMRSSRRPLVNAFAATGNSLFLSANLLESFPKDELDAIIAHELAHLRHKHAYLNLVITLVPLILFNRALSIVPIPFIADNGFLFAIPPALVLTGFLTRRQERAADRSASLLLDDPIPLIRALSRLTHLNFLPTRWSGWDTLALSHPSLEQRAAAIAAHFHMPPEQALALLSEPLQEPTDTYPIPSPDSHRLLAGYVRRSTIPGFVAYSLALSAPLIAATWLTPLAPPALIWAAAILCSLLLVRTAETLRRTLAFRRLERAFRTRSNTHDGLFVGLSPSAETRFYQGLVFWDIGLLHLHDGVLHYHGELAQFTLSTGACPPPTPVRITFGWTRPESFLFSVPDSPFRLTALTNFRAFAPMLTAWRAAPPPEPAPAPLALPPSSGLTPAQAHSLHLLIPGFLLLFCLAAGATAIAAPHWSSAPPVLALALSALETAWSLLQHHRHR